MKVYLNPVINLTKKCHRYRRKANTCEHHERWRFCQYWYQFNMDTKCKNFYLYYSALTASMMSMATGCKQVWNSPVIPKLMSNDTSINPLGIPISVLQVSLLTALNPIGIIMGTVLIGKLPDIIGRKKTLILITTGGMVSFIGLYFARYLYQYIILLLLMSTNVSAVIIVAPIYTAEIAEDCNRGNLGSLMTFWAVLGQLYGYVVGAVTTVNTFFLLCALPSFIVLIMSIFIPESPIYLSMKGDKIGGMRVLKTLRPSKTMSDIETEFYEKEHVLNDKKKDEHVSLKSFCVSRSVRKALILSIATRCLSDLSGLTIVLSFMATLLNDAQTNISGDNLAIIVMVIKILASIVTIFVIEKAGRRILILSSALVCGTSMFALGLYFYFKINNYLLHRSLGLIPIIAIVCFLSSYSFGLSAVPCVLRAELLPNELRAIGSSIAQFIGTAALIAVSFAYPLVSTYLGVQYNMFTFSLFCFTGFTFLFFHLPETKGKSFAEIRNLLK
ncbi:uncharacterized protein LOC130445117 isoform X1 [Diorhabda sublineata]|uniref:uncharacterized protein LOC130445117 isoform X1 n=2 Tax=Diorhabda sublineata TaxID=1163346 RepID=UPI0024E14DFB|nr:uncharacterized protein LOC130445117 isoform X1 [Diorhabda sublineata]XP_056636607.1 uncharacterized protein LOC130445117 isoform X1 [Diorhabda sublineata]XP_056636608.1 uncharacterized protein LOC130445117 isoform X1 [Diorhabda sublineata]